MSTEAQKMSYKEIWWMIIKAAALLSLTACKASQASLPIMPTPSDAPVFSGQVTVGEVTKIALSGDEEVVVSLTPHHTWLEGDVLYTFLWSEENVHPVAIDLPGGQVHDLKTEMSQRQIGQARYLARTQGHPTGEGLNYWDQVHVFDLQSGEETVLGGTGRSLYYPAVSGSIIVWDERSMTSTLGVDIHAYDMATGQTFTITQRPGQQARPVIEGEWVVYRNRVIDDPRNPVADIYLHNIVNGEERLLGTNRYAADATEGVYAIANGRVVWNEWSAGEWQDGKWYEVEPSLHVHELSNGAERILNSSAPLYFVLSGDLLVSDGWGYDLAQDILFDVPRVGNTRAVFVSETRIVWLVIERQSNDTSALEPIRYQLFTASIER